MLTIASIMLALSVLTTSPALCKPYISVPTECGIVEEYRECEVVESRYDGSRGVYVVTVKTADGQLWDMLVARTTGARVTGWLRVLTATRTPALWN